MFHAGIDLHKKYSYIVVLNDQGDVVSQDRVENDNILAYLEAFSEPLQVTFEATYNWQQLYDVLDGHVARLVLAHPKQVKAIAAAKVKTDRIDARVLADLLRVNLLPIAYAAPQPIRDLRDLMRHRVQLVRQRTQIKNRIHAVLARYPLSRVPGGLFSKRGRAYLQTVTLRPSHRTILDDDLWVLDQLNQRIHERDKQIARLARSQPEAHLLTTIPGVGPFSALMIIAELGDIGRFTTPKQVAS